MHTDILWLIQIRTNPLIKSITVQGMSILENRQQYLFVPFSLAAESTTDSKHKGVPGELSIFIKNDLNEHQLMLSGREPYSSLKLYGS